VHIRGLRGATTVPRNTEEEIHAATRELLQRMLADNDAEPDEIAAILFTATPDLTAAFPAEAARQLEWTTVPLMSATEINVPGALPRCVRVLMLWNSSRSQEQVRHVYLRAAAALRPDLKPQK
jgi:chorismate mutase